MPGLLSALFLATAIRISDGDILIVLNDDRQPIKIWLVEVDAAEKHQPFSTQSKKSLSDLRFGKKAKVAPQIKDQYGRTGRRELRWDRG